ncbi:MAG: hypothetical protein NVSMB34_08380 [Variovorax sp.]
MADHSANALGAAVKALTQVVAPAVDPHNPLAVEQLRLVGLYLDFLTQQRPHERRLAWKDLSLQCDLARQAGSILNAALPDMGRRLLQAVERAEAQLRLPIAPTSHWEHLHGELAELLAEAIATASSADATLRDALDSLVLSYAREQLLLHRVWFLPYGFEARPDSLPTLEGVLAGAPEI